VIEVDRVPPATLDHRAALACLGLTDGQVIQVHLEETGAQAHQVINAVTLVFSSKGDVDIGQQLVNELLLT